MRLFKCVIATEDGEKQDYTLTGDELVEFLNGEINTFIRVNQ